MWIAAAALGVAIGIIIGGLGGGGGVLAVPALVYVLGQTAHDATTSSVIIVGIGAATGVLARRRRGVDWRTGAALGAVGIPLAYLGTALNNRTSQPVLLLAFAALTLAAAVALLINMRNPADHGIDDAVATTDGAGTDTHRPTAGHNTTGATVTTAAAPTPDTRQGHAAHRAATIVACGTTIGFLTGFLGVGGGFLIVPALVIALRLPIVLAIGTSLLVIVLNSVAAMASRLGALHLDWTVVAPFTIAIVVGTLVGKLVADRLSGAVLTRSFAVLLITVGLGVGAQNLLAL